MNKFFSLLILCGFLVSAFSFVDVCTITDTSTGDNYDLSSLRKRNDDWTVQTPQYTYFLNMCGTKVTGKTIVVNGTPKSCSTDSNACQINAKLETEEPKSLGNTTTLSIIDKGELEYVFSLGDPCRGGINRKAIILLHCNKNAGIGAPVFVDESEKCTYVFDWETSAACPTNTGTIAPPSTKACHVIDASKNVRYDLTPLSLTQGNWVVDHEKYQYLLNICDQVHGVTKCEGHGACQLMPSDSTYAKQLGRSPALPILEDGVLKVKMTDGQLCHDTFFRQTVIVFSCREGSGLGRPRFVTETDDCMYVFAWESSAACGEPLTEVCSAKDSETGKEVDISHLSKQPGQTNWQAKTYVENDLATYKINVCNTLIPGDHTCREGTSICQMQPGATAGRSLGSYGTLSVSNDEVVLKFTDGDICPGTTQRVVTEIYLICDPDVIDGVPRLVSSVYDCEYFFTWRTAEACEGKSSPKGKTNAGLIIFVVIFVLISVLFLGGVLYNRYVRKEKGLYQIPLYDLFQACYYTAREKVTGVGAGAVQL